MKKNLLLIIASFAAAVPMYGDFLTPDQALQRMQIESGISLPTRGSKSHELLFTSYLSMGDAAVYVFDNAGSPGYIVLSADDVMAPVLGYADNGKFNKDEIPPQLKWWIEQYGRQIAYARESGISKYVPSTRADRKPVSPLIKTKWNQSNPFNEMCPVINGKRTVTGCVATAMAQVMKFWNYPDQGTGSATISVEESGESFSMSFSEQKFDWGNMLDVYNSVNGYNDTQANAVAYLMKACGYACDMQYGVGESGASSINAAHALITNFKYNSNLQYWDRNYFSAEAWGDMIYEEVASGRPVLYGGSSPTAGHEFVCDGYSSEGFFHFNWGWGGISDGYFLLDALNPGSLGSGGGEGGGYNYGQDIITGIQPSTSTVPSARLVQLGNLKMVPKLNSMSLSIDNGNRTGLWANMGLQALDVSIGVSIEPVDGTSGTTQYVTFASGKVNAPEIKPNGDNSYQILYYGLTKGDVTLPKNLSDGKYKLTVCSKTKDAPESDYLPVLCVSEGYNYGYFTKSGSTYTVEDLGTPELTITKASILSDLYYRESAKVSITLTNKSEKELTKTYYPKLSSGGQTIFTANGITVSVMPNETVTEEFITVFELEENLKEPTGDVTYTLGFFDPETSESYKWESEVTMKFNVPETKISLTGLELPGLSSKTFQFENGTTTRLYAVYDSSAIPISCKLEVIEGYQGSPIYFAVFPRSGGQSLIVSKFSEIPLLGAGESMTLTQTIDFTAGETGKVYLIALYQEIGGDLKQIENTVPILFELADSGVDSIEGVDGNFTVSYDRNLSLVSARSTNGIASIAIFSIDGKQISADTEFYGSEASVSIEDLPAGIFIVKAIDKTGNSKTIKIAK